MFSNLELLPDELILKICRYLSPSDILLSFCGLNYRLNRTISDFIHHIHFSSMISHENYLYLLRINLPSIWSIIQSLTINNHQIPCLTKVFLDTIENNLPVNLKRLNLFDVNVHDIYQFINRLMMKCMVEELIIVCTDTEYAKQQIFYGYKIAQMLFFHHPTLKFIELRGDIIFDLSHLSFLSLSNSENSNLMDLTNINHLQRLAIPLRSLSSLHLLLIYQPYLEYLNVHIGDTKATYGYTITPFPPLIYLREFHFHSDDLTIKFENISELLNYFPHLKSLSLDLTTECRLFFDGEILQTLVYSLELFQFSIARLSAPTSEEQTLSTFYTPFWLETKKWFTQAYWNIDSDNLDSNYFHIYSIPFPFSNFNIDKCTNENLASKYQCQLYPNVKRMDLSETSDINVIPFLKRCPYVQTICLNGIYDDEENYGTDDEEDDDIDQIDEGSDIPISDCQSIDLLLPKLSHVRYIILLALPEDDANFFERLVSVTPNLNRLKIYNDDLLQIIRYPQNNLCQILSKQISQLEIHLDYLWLSLDIRRDIPKILRSFSNIKSFTISFCSSQKNIFKTLKKLLTHLFKFQTNLLCITMEDTSPVGFESLIRQGGIELIQTWLTSSLKMSSHIHLNSSSVTIWL